MVTRALGAVAGVGERVVAPLGPVVDEIPLQRRSVAEVAHRPWPLPGRPWAMGQTWHHLLFAHWAVPEQAIDRLLPPPLTPQLYEGSAWLGITLSSSAAYGCEGRRRCHGCRGSRS